MAGRDFSKELFGEPAPAQSAGKDFSAELFGEPTPKEKPTSKEKPAPVAKAAPAPVDANAPPAYKNRAEAVDDAINLLEEGVDREELKGAFAKLGVPWKEIVARGQQRGSEYFKQTTGPVSKGAMPPTGEIKAGKEPNYLEGTVNLFKRVDAGLGDTATGLLLQTGGIEPEQAGRVIASNAKRRAAAMPDSETRAQMEEIGKAKTYGDAATALATNSRATVTMLVESVITSLPMMVPSLIVGGVPGAVMAGLSSGGMEYGSVITSVLQDKGVDLLDPNAISDALNNPKIMEEIKDKGAKRGLIVGGFDAITMGLAGRFLEPAKNLIAAGKLTGTSAKKATVAAWGKELSMQMGGGAGGEFAAQKATGDNKPVDVLLEGLAEGVSAPLEVMSNLRESGELEKQAAISSIPKDKKEPTLDDAELLKAAPPSVYRSMDDIEKDRSKEIYSQLLSQNIPADNARRIAAKRVLEERKQKIKELVVEPTNDEVRQRAKELIDGGIDPVLAMDKAQKQIIEEQKADALAQAETQGEQNVGQTITEPSGVSVPVVGQPDTDTTTTGTGIVEPSGVVPAGQDVAGTPERAAEESVAVEDPKLQGLSGGEIYAKLIKDGMPQSEAFEKATEIMDARIAALPDPKAAPQEAPTQEAPTEDELTLEDQDTIQA